MWLERQSHVRDPSPTLDYIMLAVLDGDALGLMIIIRHGDVMDTSERETVGHFKDRLLITL